MALTMAAPSNFLWGELPWNNTRWTLERLIPPIQTVPTDFPDSAMDSKITWAPAVPMIDLVFVFLISQHTLLLLYLQVN